MFDASPYEPAKSEEVEATLAEAIRSSAGGQMTRYAEVFLAGICAKHLTEQLALAGNPADFETIQAKADFRSALLRGERRCRDVQAVALADVSIRAPTRRATPSATGAGKDRQQGAACAKPLRAAIVALWKTNLKRQDVAKMSFTRSGRIEIRGDSARSLTKLNTEADSDAGNASIAGPRVDGPSMTPARISLGFFGSSIGPAALCARARPRMPTFTSTASFFWSPEDGSTDRRIAVIPASAFKPTWPLHAPRSALPPTVK